MTIVVRKVLEDQIIGEEDEGEKGEEEEASPPYDNVCSFVMTFEFIHGGEV